MIILLFVFIFAFCGLFIFIGMEIDKLKHRLDKLEKENQPYENKKKEVDEVGVEDEDVDFTKGPSSPLTEKDIRNFLDEEGIKKILDLMRRIQESPH